MVVRMDVSDELGDEYTLIDYLSVLRRRWVWLVVPVVLATSAAFAYSSTRPENFAAAAQVLLADTAAQRTLDPSSQNANFLRRELSNEISLAQSDLVKSRVADELGRLPSVMITGDESADLLTFASLAADPEAAAAHANTWAESYVNVKQDQAVESIVLATNRMQLRLEEIRAERQVMRAPLDELQDEIARTSDLQELAALQAKFDRLSADLSYELELLTAQSEAAVTNLSDLELQAEIASVGEARIVQLAAPPTSPANPPASRNLALGLMVGIIVGAALALLVDLIDNRIRSIHDLERFNVPVLAAIPAASRQIEPILDTVAVEDPSSSAADGYQKLRSAVDFMATSSGIRSVLVTSPNAAEGKSTTSSNLALALSEVGRPTALVDVDFRKGRVHEIYGCGRSPGLADAALGTSALPHIGYGVSGSPDLLVIPMGSKPPNPAAFVGTEAFQAAIGAIPRGRFTVFDSPPFLAVSDTSSIARQVDGVIVTVRSGKTKQGELQKVLTGLEQIGARVLGMVLVGAAGSDAYSDDYYRRTGEIPGPAGQQRSRTGRVAHPGENVGSRTSPSVHGVPRSNEGRQGVSDPTATRPIDVDRLPTPRHRTEIVEVEEAHRLRSNGDLEGHRESSSAAGADGQAKRVGEAVSGASITDAETRGRQQWTNGASLNDLNLNGGAGSKNGTGPEEVGRRAGNFARSGVNFPRGDFSDEELPSLDDVLADLLEDPGEQSLGVFDSASLGDDVSGQHNRGIVSLGRLDDFNYAPGAESSAHRTVGNEDGGEKAREAEAEPLSIELSSLFPDDSGE